MTDRYADLRAALDDVLENGKQAVRWAPSSAYWSNELKRLFGEDAREGIDALEAQLRAAQAEIARLREALRPLAEIDLAAPPPNDFAWFVLRARAALAQEQGGSDASQA